jgi:cytochrome P450
MFDNRLKRRAIGRARFMTLSRRRFLSTAAAIAAGQTLIRPISAQSAVEVALANSPLPLDTKTVTIDPTTADDLQRVLHQHAGTGHCIQLARQAELTCLVREEEVEGDRSIHPLLVPRGVRLDLNGSTLLLDLRSNCYGVRLSSDSAIRNGTIRVVRSEGKGSQACWHSGISVGAAYGDGGTPQRPGAFSTVSRFAIENITIDQPFAAAAIQFMSEACHGLVRDVRILDSDHCLLGIGLDWGSVGPITTADAEIANMRQLWERGKIYSTHPHDITIENIRVGHLRRNVDGNDAGVRCSACHRITIRDVEVKSAATAVAIFGGDCGYEYARADQREEQNTGYLIEDVRIDRALIYGIVLNGAADNVYRARRDLGYKTVRDPVHPGLDRPVVRNVVLRGAVNDRGQPQTAAQGIYAVAVTADRTGKCRYLRLRHRRACRRLGPRHDVPRLPRYRKCPQRAGRRRHRTRGRRRLRPAAGGIVASGRGSSRPFFAAWSGGQLVQPRPQLAVLTPQLDQRIADKEKAHRQEAVEDDVKAHRRGRARCECQGKVPHDRDQAQTRAEQGRNPRAEFFSHGDTCSFRSRGSLSNRSSDYSRAAFVAPVKQRASRQGRVSIHTRGGCGPIQVHAKKGRMSKAQQPPAAEFDLSSQAFKQDPFPMLAAMREQGPLIRVRFPLFGKVWMATTFDAVNDLLRDHQRFLQNPITAGNRWMGTLVRWLPRTIKPLTTNMLIRDRPDHQRLRRLVDQAFQRHSVEALRPRLEVLADEALDNLSRQADGAPGGVDLLAHFARPFPLAVICELLGLPPEDRPIFVGWASRFFSSASVPSMMWAFFVGLGKMMRYICAEFRRQSKHPRDGLMAALIEAEEAGDRLTEDELVAMVFLLLAAGFETTLHQIALSVLTLLDHPGQLAELSADWGLADSAVQELLRFNSFAQVGKPRYACADTEFCGQAIRRGQMLFGCLAAANSDPNVFEHPERLDIHRQPNRHLAFGAGIHVCLGARLARVETAIALERLFTRFPQLQLAAPRSEIRFSARFGTRALLALPVRW